MPNPKHQSANGKDYFPRKEKEDEKEGSFIQLKDWLLQSSAYRALSANAKVTLNYVVMHHNGVNNGRIGFGVRSGCYYTKALVEGRYKSGKWKTPDDEAKARDIGLSRGSIANALRELESAGFIARQAESRWSGTKGKAGGEGLVREWRLTWIHVGTGANDPRYIPATMDFMKRDEADFRPVPRKKRIYKPRPKKTDSGSTSVDGKERIRPPAWTGPAMLTGEPPVSVHQGGPASLVPGPPAWTHIRTIPSDSEAATLNEIAAAVKAAAVEHEPHVASPQQPANPLAAIKATRVGKAALASLPPQPRSTTTPADLAAALEARIAAKAGKP